MRRFWSFIVLLLVVCQSGICLSADDESPVYRSPYSVKLPWTAQELNPDLLEGERGMARNEANISEFNWYGHSHP